MKNSNVVVVQIEHCQNCHLHSWCSRHDQNKYKQHVQKVRSYVYTIFPSADFRVNRPQDHYQIINQPTSKGQTKYFDHQQQQIVNFPRFGSFQISVNGSLIFSKIQSNLWPKHDRIGMLLQKIKVEIENNNKVQMFSLQYRLKNDDDEYFRETYKKVIQKNFRTNLLGPMSQNKSQVVSSGHRSSINALRPGNTNFVSRKIHQSLMRKQVPAKQDKQLFIRTYKPENHSGSRQLRRPMTNQLSRSKGNAVVGQFNGDCQNYGFQSEQLRKDEQNAQKLRLRGSPNPRKRLQILRDVASKPQVMRSSPFNANKKQPQKIQSNIKKVEGPPQTQSIGKKMANLQKFCPNNFDKEAKRNKWVGNNHKISPLINPSEPKHQQRLFKRVVMKNQQRLKLSQHRPENKDNQNLKKQQQKALERSEQRLIAKLQEEDIKQISISPIKVAQAPKHEQQTSYKAQQINVKDKQVQLQIEEKSQIVDGQNNKQQAQEQQQKDQRKQEEAQYQQQVQKVSKLSEKQVQLPEKHDTQRSMGQNQIKSQKQQVEEYDQFEQQFEQQVPKQAKQGKQLRSPVNLKSQQNNKDKVSQQNQPKQTQELLPKNNIQQTPEKQMVEEQYHNELKQEQARQTSKQTTQNQLFYNNQEQYKMEQQQRKKSTSIQNTYINGNKNLANVKSPSPNTVREVSLNNLKNQTNNERVVSHNSQSRINAWSKKENQYADQVYQYQLTDKKIQKNTSSKNLQLKNRSQVKIGQSTQKEAQQQLSYEEDLDFQQGIIQVQYKQNQILEPRETQDKQQKQQYKLPEQQLIEEIQNEKLPDQRPQSRDSRSHSHRKKVHSVQEPDRVLAQNRQGQSKDQVQSKKDFTKKENTFPEYEESKKAEYQDNYEEDIQDQDKDIPNNKGLNSIQKNIQKTKQGSQKLEQSKKQLHQQQNGDKQIKNDQIKDEQIQKQQQRFEEQLSQVDQSHRSIPIIVKANDGTRRVIQEEVEKELEQMYIRQEQQKQGRQRILSEMMNSKQDQDNKGQMEQKYQDQEQFEEQVQQQPQQKDIKAQCYDQKIQESQQIVPKQLNKPQQQVSQKGLQIVSQKKEDKQQQKHQIQQQNPQQNINMPQGQHVSQQNYKKLEQNQISHQQQKSQTQLPKQQRQQEISQDKNIDQIQESSHIQDKEELQQNIQEVDNEIQAQQKHTQQKPSKQQQLGNAIKQGQVNQAQRLQNQKATLIQSAKIIPTQISLQAVQDQVHRLPRKGDRQTYKVDERQKEQIIELQIQQTQNKDHLEQLAGKQIVEIDQEVQQTQKQGQKQEQEQDKKQKDVDQGKQTQKGGTKQEQPKEKQEKLKEKCQQLEEKKEQLEEKQEKNERKQEQPEEKQEQPEEKYQQFQKNQPQIKKKQKQQFGIGIQEQQVIQPQKKPVQLPHDNKKQTKQSGQLQPSKKTIKQQTQQDKLQQEKTQQKSQLEVEQQQKEDKKQPEHKDQNYNKQENHELNINYNQTTQHIIRDQIQEMSKKMCKQIENLQQQQIIQSKKPEQYNQKKEEPVSEQQQAVKYKKVVMQEPNLLIQDAKQKEQSVLAQNQTEGREVKGEQNRTQVNIQEIKKIGQDVEKNPDSFGQKGPGQIVKIQQKKQLIQQKQQKQRQEDEKDYKMTKEDVIGKQRQQNQSKRQISSQQVPSKVHRQQNEEQEQKQTEQKQIKRQDHGIKPKEQIKNQTINENINQTSKQQIKVAQKLIQDQQPLVDNKVVQLPKVKPVTDQIKAGQSVKQQSQPTQRLIKNQSSALDTKVVQLYSPYDVSMEENQRVLVASSSKKQVPADKKQTQSARQNHSPEQNETETKPQNKPSMHQNTPNTMKDQTTKIQLKPTKNNPDKEIKPLQVENQKNQAKEIKRETKLGGQVMPQSLQLKTAHQQ